MNNEIATFSSCSRKSSRIAPLNQDLHKMTCSCRTQGDGMENINTATVTENSNKTRLGDCLIYHPTNLKIQCSIPPVTPTGQIVNLVPKTVVTQMKKKQSIVTSLKSKEPKFIPYEPYKAAVNPIIPIEKKKKKVCSKNNLDISIMAAQLANLTAEELRPENFKKEIQRCEKKGDENKEVEFFKKEYEAEIRKLKEENSELENQLKFQAQVNGELKNLLVAAVGEDIETKVHLLTEDKLQLARALLNSAQHLSTHQEQTEWLAGQCEVWRSKFLASSLMVEELAKWKAALCQRTTDLQEITKRLLEERNKVRDTAFRTYRTLSILRENFDPFGKRHELPSANIIDLSEGCCQLSELLKVHLLSGMHQINLKKEIDITGLDMKTIAEKRAEHLIMNSSSILMCGRQEAACSAVMGAAVALGGKTFFSPKSVVPSIVCCPHCSGEVKQV